MQLIFSKAGAVGGGMTLNGRGVLPMAWVATGARLQMRPPRGAGTVSGVAMYVDGVAAGPQFTVPGWAGWGLPPVVEQQLNCQVGVAAGAVVTWGLVGGPGAAEQWSDSVAVTVTGAPGVVANAVAGAATYALNSGGGPPVGSGTVPVYTWTAAGGWVAQPLADVCAVAVQPGGMSTASFSLQMNASTRAGANPEVLGVQGGVMRVTRLTALGGAANPGAPRVDWLVNGQRVASSGADGSLAVAGSVVEAAAGDAAWTRDAAVFQWFSGGVLTAVLGAGGLVALGVVETG